MMSYARGLMGLVILLGIAYMFSRNRKSIDWELVIKGLLLQIVFGVLVLKVEFVADGFKMLSHAFVILLNFSIDGAKFIFGDLAVNSYAVPAANHSLGFIFAFQVLPTIIFFSTVSTGLYYLGILQKIVFGIAWVMSKVMRLSGAESVATAGNVFLGQTEAPLLIRPFVKNMTESEIMCLMTGGMATIAGGVLAAYVTFLGGSDIVAQERFATHLLTASIMNAPAAIILSKILLPEMHPEKIDRNLKVNKESLGVNLIDAMSRGASDGGRLAINVGVMLLAFIAVIAMVNYGVRNLIGEPLGLNAWVVSSTSGAFDGLSLEYLLGQVFRIFAWIIGVEWADTVQVGSLLGTKLVVNEFIAYQNLAGLKEAGAFVNEKSIIISTYALCGFSNFSSIAIQVAGIGGIAPNQQGTLSKLGMIALLGATLACMMTATIAGAFVSI